MVCTYRANLYPPPPLPHHSSPFSHPIPKAALHPGRSADLEVLRLEGQSVLTVHHGPLPVRHREAAPLHDGGDEEEHLHLGQLFPRATPPARPEWQKPLSQLPVDASGAVQEPFRVEALRVGEDVLVTDERPEVDEHQGVSGDEEAVEDGVPRGAVRQGQGEEAGVSHHLQDHRLCVREAREVF